MIVLYIVFVIFVAPWIWCLRLKPTETKPTKEEEDIKERSTNDRTAD